MSLETELTAILTTAAIAPITDRAFLRVTGPDATRWLNGMVTNNIKDLAPGEGNYNFLLNAQGRIQADCTIYRDSDSDGPVFLLKTHSSQLTAVKQTLDKFIIMDDVEVATVEGRSGFLVLGPTALSLLAATDVTHDAAEPNELVRIDWISSSIKMDLIRGEDNLTPTYEIWSDVSGLNKVYGLLITAGATLVSPAALEAYRILSGTPRYGTDIRNTDTAKDLPQETAQTHALNFNKGCYLGQEIVERIHSRGQVHRTFARFELTGNLPTLPCALTLDGKPVGELTSAALIPLVSGATLRALGYIRREAATATLTYPGGAATVLDSKPL